MPKLADIANEVGVSNKTVSLTLRGKKCASDETMQRILDVANRIGYVPNQAARMVRTQEAPFIGVLANMVATTPFTVDLVRGAQTEAVSQRRTLLIGSPDGDGKSTSEVMRMFSSFRAVGVIYASLFRQQLDQEQSNTAGNVVFANCFLPGKEDRAILPDDEQGGYQQASHLLELGHRRIAILTLPEQAPATSLRLAGIVRAMNEHQMTIDPDLCRAGVEGFLPEGETYVAYERALELLKMPNRPSAIICGNDRIALMVLSAAAQLGVRVPQDLSIVGFDDFQPVSEIMRPRLTTVGLPYFEIGRQAVQAILQGPDEANAFAPVPCALVERESCAPFAS